MGYRAVSFKYEECGKNWPGEDYHIYPIKRRPSLNAADESNTLPKAQSIRTMRLIFKDCSGKLCTTWYSTPSRQLRFCLSKFGKILEHLKCIIFKNDLQQLTVSVISDLRKMIFQQTSHFNKRLIGNAENLINAAAFNRINAVFCLQA